MSDVNSYLLCQLLSFFPLAPSEALMVMLSDNTLSWREPAELYGETLLRFEILAARSDDPSKAEIIHTIDPLTTSFSLDELRPLLPPGQSFVWVSTCKFLIVV